MTKYSTIAASLREQIELGTYGIGDKLPTIPELCARYGVSKITLRRAMDELERLGLVTRRRGSGTFVKGPRPTNTPLGLATPHPSPFAADVDEPNDRHFVTVHAIEVLRPTPDQAHTLQIDEDSFVYSICRTLTRNERTQVVEYTTVPVRLCAALRTSDVERSLYRHLGESCYRMVRTLFADEVICLEATSYIPTNLVPNLTADDGDGPIFAYLENATGLRITSFYRKITAIHPDAATTVRLGVNRSEAVMQIQQTAFLENGRPIELSISTHTPGYEFYCVVPN